MIAFAPLWMISTWVSFHSLLKRRWEECFWSFVCLQLVYKVIVVISRIIDNNVYRVGFKHFWASSSLSMCKMLYCSCKVSVMSRCIVSSFSIISTVLSLWLMIWVSESVTRCSSFFFSDSLSFGITSVQLVEVSQIFLSLSVHWFVVINRCKLLNWWHCRFCHQRVCSRNFLMLYSDWRWCSVLFLWVKCHCMCMWYSSMLPPNDVWPLRNYHWMY